MFEKNLALNELYDLYAELLSPKKRRVFELYYSEDLSLFEVAQETGISRQGARDLISRTAKELEEYESLLKLREKRKAVGVRISELRELFEDCDGEKKRELERISSSILSLFGQ